MKQTDRQTLESLKKFFKSETSFDEYVTKCQEAYKSFPVDIQYKAIEYYTLLSAADKGNKLSEQEVDRAFELLKPVSAYGITPLSFKQDLFPTT